MTTIFLEACQKRLRQRESRGRILAAEQITVLDDLRLPRSSRYHLKSATAQLFLQVKRPTSRETGLLFLELLETAYLKAGKRAILARIRAGEKGGATMAEGGNGKLSPSAFVQESADLGRVGEVHQRTIAARNENPAHGRQYGKNAGDGEGIHER